MIQAAKTSIYFPQHSDSDLRKCKSKPGTVWNQTRALLLVFHPFSRSTFHSLKPSTSAEPS